LDPIFFFCLKQHGATRATTAADFQDWSKEQGGDQTKDRREEKKQQWQGRSKPAKTMSQIDASAPPRAKNWAVVAEFRGLAQATALIV
jgi:hypothetical protein